MPRVLLALAVDVPQNASMEVFQPDARFVTQPCPLVNLHCDAGDGGEHVGRYSYCKFPPKVIFENTVSTVKRMACPQTSTIDIFKRFRIEKKPLDFEERREFVQTWAQNDRSRDVKAAFTCPLGIAASSNREENSVAPSQPQVIIHTTTSAS